MIVSFIQNLSLLITLSFLYWIIRIYNPTEKVLYHVLQGIWFGAVAIAAMMMPYNYIEGVIYDGRSIVMLLAGFLGGVYSVIISMIIAGLYRIFIGGMGMWAGLMTIIFCGIIGLIIRSYSRRKNKPLSFWQLIGFGVFAHIIVLLCQLLIPDKIGIDVIRKIGLVVLTLFPLTFALIAKFILYFDGYLIQEQKNRKLVFWLNETQKAGKIGSYTYDFITKKWYCTDVLYEMFGVVKATFASMDDWKSFIHPDDLQDVNAYIDDKIHKGENKFEIAYRICKQDDGSEHWVLERGKMKFNREGSVGRRFGTIVDITETKRYEQQLVESENRFRNAIIKAPIPIVVHDEDGKLINISEGWTHFSGYELKDIPTIKEWTQKAFGNKAKEMEKYIGGLSKEVNTVHHGEYNIITKDGGTRIWDFYTTPLGEFLNGEKIILGIAPDVTRRVRALSKLEESEKTFRLLFENHTAVKLLVNPADGVIHKANKAAGKFYGLSVEQLEGVNISQLNVKSNKDVFQIIEDKISNNQNSFELEQQLANNQLRHVEVFFNLIEDKGEKLLHLIIQDISDKKRIHNELILAKERAEESDRLKTAFLANMSHEIRTPLNAIMGFSSLLPDEESKEDIVRFSNIIVNNSEYLVHLIDDIMLYSKLQSRLEVFYPSKFEVGKLFDDIINVFELNRQETRVPLKVKFGVDKSSVIYSDYNKLKQLLMNYISNAFKYTTEGDVWLGVEPQNDNILFYVSDSGIGFPTGENLKIFDRFYRADNVPGTSGGTGLGLSIVVELAELLDGKAWAENNEEVGSTFYFLLNSH